MASTSPLAPALEEKNYDQQTGKFLHRFLQQSSLCCCWSPHGSSRGSLAEEGCSHLENAQLDAPYCQLSQPQAGISHWKSKTIVQDKSPGCDIIYNQMGSAFIFVIKYKQLMFQTARPFTVADLHIFILNEMVSGHSPWISNEIFRPSDILHSVADTFSRLHNLSSLISLTTEAALSMAQLTAVRN